MEGILERNMNIKILPLKGSVCLLKSSLLDLAHSMHVELEVDLKSGEIIRADASMPKVPYKVCRSALVNISKLAGLKIGRGVTKQVANIMGRDTGCTHIVEVIQSTIRFGAAMMIGEQVGHEHSDEVKNLDEKAKINVYKPFLRNSCVAFKD